MGADGQGGTCDISLKQGDFPLAFFIPLSSILKNEFLFYKTIKFENEFSILVSHFKFHFSKWILCMDICMYWSFFKLIYNNLINYQVSIIKCQLSFLKMMDIQKTATDTRSKSYTATATNAETKANAKTATAT